MKKIVLINDTDERENIGCRLTSSMLKQSITRVFSEINVNAEVISAPWFFKPFATRSGRRFFSDFLDNTVDALGHAFLREIAVNEYGEAAVVEVENADYLIYQPEGTISDNYSELRVFRHLSLPLYSLLYANAPFCILNGTFPIFQDSRKKLIVTLLSATKYSSLRDRMSADFYKCSFSPDAALMWSGQVNLPSDKCEYVLITTGAGLSQEANLVLASVALDYCKSRNLRPMVLTKDWQSLSSLRNQVMLLGGVFFEYADLATADKLLSLCRLHIGGRYHMAIFCATKGIPSYLVKTNTHKNIWLEQEIRGIRVFDTSQMISTIIATEDKLPLSSDMLEDVMRCREVHLYEMRIARDALVSTAAMNHKKLLGNEWIDDQSRKRLNVEFRREYYSLQQRRIKNTLRKLGFGFSA